MEYQHLIRHPKYTNTWWHSYGNETGRLAQGMPGRVIDTKTMFFISKAEVPANRHKDITYGCIVCNDQKGKPEPNCTRLIIGSDWISYPDDCDMPTDDLLTVKLLLNSVISTPGAQCITMDIKNFYLDTPLKWYEYLWLDNIQEDVQIQYKLQQNQQMRDG